MSLRSERGSAVILVALALAILIFIAGARHVLSLSHSSVQRQLNFTAQAGYTARAGLTDVVAWFKRQTTQPVHDSVTPDAAFAPLQSQGDTIDESLGLVQERVLSEAGGPLWSRYEVPKSAVHDVTDMRMPGRSAGEGIAWSIQSVGYVYRRLDPARAFNQPPNEIVGKARLSTELRRLLIDAPWEALTIRDVSQLSVQTRGQILGDATYAAVGYSIGTQPGIPSGAVVTGTPQFDGTIGSFNIASVLGMPASEIKQVADLIIDGSSSLPTPYPESAVVVVSSSIVFDATHPLQGGGILLVEGNLTVPARSIAVFQGLIYVTGDAVIEGPALITGTLVVEGSLTLRGLSDVATLRFDPTVISTMQQRLGVYRELRAPHNAL